MTFVSRAVIVACLVGGCKDGAVTSAIDSGRASDAGGDARGSAGQFVDAAPSPDDSVLPVPGDQLTTRAAHLLEAISEDDASLAGDLLFPRDAWLATRDAQDPGKDWEVHVAEPFRRGVHALSRKYRGLNHPQVVSFVLGGAVLQATPRRLGWKKALWTAIGSRLTFVADGRTRVVSIREMAAWRGAWYITRLR